MPYCLILRDIPSRGWMEVSTCRHGEVFGSDCPHYSQDSFAVLLLSRQPAMQINDTDLQPHPGPTVALMGPGSTWMIHPDEVMASDPIATRSWMCLASPVWRSADRPLIEQGLAIVSAEGSFARYEQQLSTIYHELIDTRGRFRRGLCSSLFHSLAAEIVLNASDLARPSYTRNDMQRLFGEIRAQPARRFRLPDLARMIGLSPRQLRRIFVSEIGKTPKEFEIECRMAHAEYLLANRGLKVYEVAEECGYSDPFLFSRQFKKLQGQSPRAYRLGSRH